MTRKQTILQSTLFAAAITVGTIADARPGFGASGEQARLDMAGGPGIMKRGGRFGGGTSGESLITRLDTNGDQLVDIDEFSVRAASAGERIARQDSDGDGTVSLEEFTARQQRFESMFAEVSDEILACIEEATGESPLNRPTAEERFADTDANEDGQIDADEATAAALAKAAERFAAFDANEDGYIDTDEADQAVADRRAKREAVMACRETSAMMGAMGFSL